MPYYAHSNALDPSNWQKLIDHLENTAHWAAEMGSDASLDDFAALAGWLHDIGKYSTAFQRRLAGDPRRVDHATAGAVEIIKRFSTTPQQKAIATLLAYCIAGHHGGLPDYGNVIDVADDSTLCGRLKRADLLEDYQAYAQEVDLASLPFPSHLPIRPNPQRPGFSVAFFTRMLYSTLVDADFLDTETFMNGAQKPRGGYAEIPVLCQRFDQFLEGFDRPATAIDRQRTLTLGSCIDKAAEPPGFFSLTVPTGGGKTFSSMAFALHHARTYGLKRVIYVIPYTSIIEQNAAQFKRSLGEATVLEHHANFEFDRRDQTDDELGSDAGQKLKLAAENWDIPIVVTTNVQFFESLFANRSSRCRKLHNLAKSVVIFDEAQMLPRGYLRPCLHAVDELVRNYGVTAVFCTATQPVLEAFLPAGTRVSEITPNPNELYAFYKRVWVRQAGPLTDEALIARLEQQPQALCIVNTRKHAAGLFKSLAPEGRFHLSTLMCPAHRRKVIATIRQRLAHGLPCRVVSTQIMEAGIDVDFPVGYRALAGLDSIVQAAGRVNREGRQTGGGELFVFEPDSLCVKRTPAYIQQGAEVARKILREYPDPIALEAVRDYFSQVYDLQSPQAFDYKGILNRFDKRTGQMDFDFRAAAEDFKLIENDSRAVVIPFNEKATDLIHAAGASRFPHSFARKLQTYTVNIYAAEYRALEDRGVLDLVGGLYPVLRDLTYYDADRGLKIPESDSGEGIYFDG